MINRCLNDLQNTIFVETIGNIFYPIVLYIYEVDSNSNENIINISNDSFAISFVKDDVIKYTYTVGNGITLNANEMKFSFIGGITNIDEGDYTCYVRWTSSLYGVNDIARFFMKVLPNNF